MTTQERLLARWRELGRPTLAPASDFMVTMVSKTAVARARENLGIESRREGKSTVWDFSRVIDVEPEAEPEVEEKPPAPVAPRASYDVSIPPTAGGRVDVRWITEGDRDSYVETAEGRRLPTRFEEV